MKIAGTLGSATCVVVTKFSRRNPWLPIDDLVQEAALAALTANPRWEARTVALALSQFVASARSPVHVPDARGAAGTPTRAAWEAAANSRRERLMHGTSAKGRDQDGEHNGGSYDVTADVAAVCIERFQSPEDRIDTARAVAEVRRIMAAQSEAARAVLLEEEKSAAVARRLGVSVRRVYDETWAATRALRAVFATMEAA